MKLFKFLAPWLLLPFGLSPAWAFDTQNKQILWQATKGDQTLYLLGSIHLTHPSFYPLDADIYKAYELSDVLVMEIGTEISSPETAALMDRRSKLPAGQDLLDMLSEATLNKARAAGDKYGVPIEMFRFRKPWFYVITLAANQYVKLGYQAHLGIDLHFQQRAIKDAKQVIGLETIDEQLDFFDQMMTTDTDEFINQTLDEMAASESFIQDMAKAWKSGNADQLDKILDHSMQNYPEIEAVLLHQRNRNWMQKIPQLLAAHKTLFVVVGAAHLVGDQGLPQLLKQQGFTLQQL